MLVIYGWCVRAGKDASILRAAGQSPHIEHVSGAQPHLCGRHSAPGGPPQSLPSPVWGPPMCTTWPPLSLPFPLCALPCAPRGLPCPCPPLCGALPSTPGAPPVCALPWVGPPWVGLPPSVLSHLHQAASPVCAMTNCVLEVYGEGWRKFCSECGKRRLVQVALKARGGESGARGDHS
jgi:hypothetical protein